MPIPPCTHWGAIRYATEATLGAMSPEEPGLLGNLPRSRPGTRSDKRGATGGSKPAPKRSQAAKPGVKAAAKPKPKAKAKAAPKKPKPAAKKPPAAAKPPPGPQTQPPSESRPPSPGALESAVKVAGAGLRVAEGVTREVLKRLPRP